MTDQGHGYLQAADKSSDRVINHTDAAGCAEIRKQLDNCHKEYDALKVT